MSNTSDNRVNACDTALLDPKRLAAVERTGLMDTPVDAAFDRLTDLASKILRAPITIVSLINDKKQFYKAAHGLPAPLNVVREVPIDASLCRYTLATEDIILPDTSTDPLFKTHPTVSAFGIQAFISIPMIDTEGNVLGSFCAVDMKKRPWTEDDVYVLRELTASVLTEINLRMQVNQLQLERELRNNFIATLTHDLRTPLAATKLIAQMMERTVREENELQKLARIVKNVDRSDAMIQDLLDTTQVRAGNSLQLDRSLCSLTEIVKSALDDVYLFHGDRFIVRCEENLTGYWDGKALRRIIENLVNNAIKYGADDENITIDVKKISDIVKISVHNYGTPISPEDQEIIFKAFHRSDAASKSSQQGWGLGLTLVKNLTEAHEGKVDVSSSHEAGTTFTIWLPVPRLASSHRA